MGQFVARIDRVGRVVIPAPLRRRLGLVEGSQVIVTCQQDAVVMRTRRHGIAAAQKYFTKLAPAEELWSEELIRDRRQEAQREHRT
jgi:AbrB family looped-hinge helix DNA binding protein